MEKAVDTNQLVQKIKSSTQKERQQTEQNIIIDLLNNQTYNQQTMYYLSISWVLQYSSYLLEGKQGFFNQSINNSELFKPGNKELKDNLAVNQNFVLVNEPVWKIITSLYGLNGPVRLADNAVKTKLAENKKCLYCMLFPKKPCVYCGELIEFCKQKSHMQSCHVLLQIEQGQQKQKNVEQICGYCEQKFASDKQLQDHLEICILKKEFMQMMNDPNQQQQRQPQQLARPNNQKCDICNIPEGQEHCSYCPKSQKYTEFEKYKPKESCGYCGEYYKDREMQQHQKVCKIKLEFEKNGSLQFHQQQKPQGEKTEDRSCKICLENSANYIVMTCKHVVACEKCHTKLNNTCPLCRKQGPLEKIFF